MNGQHAGAVAPSSQRYRVGCLPAPHKTLKTGDVVVMVEDPNVNNWLLRESDMTLHILMDSNENYIFLAPIENQNLSHSILDVYETTTGPHMDIRIPAYHQDRAVQLLIALESTMAIMGNECTNPEREWAAKCFVERPRTSEHWNK